MALIKRYLLLIALIVGLGACAPAASQEQYAAAPATPARPKPTVRAAVSTRAAGCTVVSRKSTPDPKQSALVPEPGPKDWSLGKDSAAVTVIEYGDFQ
jgi:hypothetical protein